MKKTIKSILSVLTLSMVLSAGVVYAIPVELLTNGDFATGDLTGWTAFGIHPVTVVNATDGVSSVRGAASDNYYVRGGDVLGENDTQPKGAAHLKSDIFTIPMATTSTDVSFFWRFMTYDSKDFDYGWAVIRLADQTFVDRPCAKTGGSGGGFEDTGWKPCTKTYDTATLVPGDDYFIRFTLLTTSDEFFPSWAYVDDVSIKANVSQVPVPEPSTILLLGAALVGLPLIRNRFHKKG